MKVLSAHSWNVKNRKKYPNGSNVNQIMDAYAKYYHEAMIEHYYNWDGINLERKKPKHQ